MSSNLERDHERKCEEKLYQALHRVLQRIRAYDKKTYEAWRNVQPRWCRLADEHHAQSPRQYMHVWDEEAGFGNEVVICVAREAGDLSFPNLYGLFAHELGHLISGSTDEDVANKTMERFCIYIYYDMYDVQWACL